MQAGDVILARKVYIMNAEPFQERPLAEREYRLWKASEQYMRGEIEVDALEEVELPYAQHFKEANITPVKRTSRDKSFLYFLTLLCIAFIVVGLLVFFLTKNGLSLALPALAVYPLRKIITYYFPGKAQ